MGPYLVIPELLQGFGVRPGEVLRDCRLPSDFFADGERLVTYLEVERLLLACERHCGCDHFGFLVGQRLRLDHLGLTGDVTLCQRIAGDALRSFVDHFNLHNAAAMFTLADAGNYLRLVYTIVAHGLTDTRHMQLGSVAGAFNVLQQLFGPAWLPVGVTFASRPTANPRLFRRYFRAPVQFDATESAVLFARHWLGEPLPEVDPSKLREVRARISDWRRRMLADFPSTVRQVLRKQLLFGRFSMDDIAAQFCMHRRTLDRHLQRHGVTYGEILESVRAETARHLLRDTQMPIQQVAESVRFSSAANFATAFRRRTGLSPSQFRRQAAAG